MICPMISRRVFLVLPEGCEPEDLLAECRRENCAWWLPAVDSCAVHALGWSAAAADAGLAAKIDRYEDEH